MTSLLKLKKASQQYVRTDLETIQCMLNEIKVLGELGEYSMFGVGIPYVAVGK